MKADVTPGSYGSPRMPATITIGPDGRVTHVGYQLATLGGTAIDAAPALPAVPRSAWGIVGLAALVLAWSCRRPREISAPAPRPRTGGFRSQPHDDVMMVQTGA